MEDEAWETQVHADPLGGLPGLARRAPVLFWRAGQQHRLTVTQDLAIGAAEEAGLSLADRHVSRLHAAIELRSDGAWVRDLGSLNGTYVDGVRVEAARLHDGCTLRIGGTEIRVRYDSEPHAVDLWPIDSFGPLVGRSVRMRELFARLDQAAGSDATVLIQGETGTGKELVAQALHQASRRASESFAVVDCAALGDELLGSELFGHARGAFTGAVATRAGVLEAAGAGTVLLDEVGELPLSMQPKLLRVLESRTVRRLGENQHRPIAVRFVAATHRDLKAMVNEGSFREDLYFRLAVLAVRVPALRDRLDDLPLLVERFGGDAASCGPAVMRELARRPWRGNVRELRNFVERASAFGSAEALASSELTHSGAHRQEAMGLPEVPIDRPFHEVRAEWLDHLERAYVTGLLERHRGNTAAAARAAGLNRGYFYRLLRRHGQS